MIRPLETEVNGVRYRSRLEARWALFFHWLQIRFEYEKQGYELGSGARFLPDFWLPNTRLRGHDHRDPQVGLFIEIKATSEEIAENVDRFAEFGMEYPLVVFAGNPPGEESESDLFYDGGYEFRRNGWDNCMLFCCCSRCSTSKVEYDESNYMQCPQCGSHDVRQLVALAAEHANTFRFDSWYRAT